jgi:hypothetical protein
MDGEPVEMAEVVERKFKGEQSSSLSCAMATR